MRQATEDHKSEQSSSVFDRLLANVRLRFLASRRRASGLPCGLNRHTLLHVQRDRFLTGVNAECFQKGEDLVTVLERCGGSMAHWILCGLTGLSARVVGGVRISARRFSPGVGVGGKKLRIGGASLCSKLVKSRSTASECVSAVEEKYDVVHEGHTGAVQQTWACMDHRFQVSAGFSDDVNARETRRRYLAAHACRYVWK